MKFGVIICSDGGYIEPARILALKGRKIIFAPHFNYIGKEGLIGHFMHVRADHTARAVENQRLLRPRQQRRRWARTRASRATTASATATATSSTPGARSSSAAGCMQEDFIFADIDPPAADKAWGVGKNAWSAREFGGILAEVMKERFKK